jgi:hypothetical protein
LRIELFLHPAKELDAFLEEILGMLLVLQAVSIRGVVVLQTEFLAFCNAIGFGEAQSFLHKFLVTHGRGV